MNLLYTLIIKPIEMMLSFLFGTYVNLTGSYGLSIILLSLSVTIIMFPLFYIAEVWKRKEQAVEKRMKRRLSCIKKYYTGQKRYCMIKATHKLEGYTAASSFRTSFGLLIQIPFFFAAYHLLSHYEPYRGVSWLFIKDFAVPDGLLWGLNLLPILMTVINIVSSSIYMKGSRAKDIVELYVMAGVFLLLLYASPAALVLYWTMNNVFSVGKSLIFLRLFPHEKYVPDPDDKTFRDYLQGFKDTVKPCLNGSFYSFVISIVLFAFQCRFLKIHKHSFVKLFLVMGVVVAFVALITLIVWFGKYRRKEELWKTLINILLVGFFFIVASGIGFYFQMQGARGGFLKKLVFSATIFADILLYVCLNYLFGWRLRQKEYKIKVSPQTISSLYWWNILFLGCSITILWPVLVFLSSPADADTTIGTILKTNFPVLISWIFLAFVFYIPAKKELRFKIACLVLFLSILVVLYHYVLPCKYGELDKAVLDMEDKLDNESILPWIGDVTVLISSMLLAMVCIRKYPVQGRNAIAVILVCLMGLTGIRLSRYVGDDNASAAKIPLAVTLPDNNSLINGYSKNGKNIVLFLSDHFCGGYMENILKEHPAYKDAFSGFTWYKNAVSPSPFTSGSVAAIFAGEDYLPVKLNEMEGNGYKKIREAANRMVDSFTSSGYKVSILGGGESYLTPTQFKGINYAEKYPYGNYYKQNYMNEKQTAYVSQGLLFIMLSLFQNAPYFLKPIIYNDAGWFIFSKKAQYRTVENKVIYDYGLMKMLPEVLNAEETGNTFKFIHSTMTHRPWVNKKDGTVVEPGEFPDETAESFWTGDAAYYSCSAFITLFIEYIDWLKKNDIYDNTYILLISDHGNDHAGHNPFINEHDYNRLNPLFMIKPFTDKGKESLKADETTFICLSDIPAFLENARNNTPVIIPEHRVLYPIYFKELQNFLNTGHVEIIRSFEVIDNIFDENNWREIK